MRIQAPVLILLIWMALGLAVTSRALQHDMGHHHMEEMGEMPASSPEMQAKLDADKRFSEFNHRIAGVFVMLAGLFTLLEPFVSKRVGFVRYLWATFFFIPGVYLFFLSDPESWPVGPQTLQYVITSNHQVLQHKIFSLILLTLGAVEFLRVRYDLKSVWAIGLFPVLAAAGAVLLLFHSHPMAPGTEMDPAEHLSMIKIEHQHLGFAAVGFGIALSKAATDWGRSHTGVMRNIFAVLLVMLGLLLLAYTE
jgi:hypothetical protein